MKNPELTPRQLADLRLMELASILDTAVNYDQGIYIHTCGSPACALGHWAKAHPERWTFESAAPVLHSYPNWKDGLTATQRSAMIEFDLNGWNEVDDLFGSEGCDDAISGRHAAGYIRQFVRLRQ
jgi:hypothetical protein